MEKTTLHIARIVGGGVCTSTLDGRKVYTEIRAGIMQGKLIELSFESVTRITTAFLNAAVGQLYGEFPENQIKSQLLAPTNADNRVLSRLKLVVDRAKIFFSNRKAAEQIVVNSTGIEVDEQDH